MIRYAANGEPVHSRMKRGWGSIRRRLNPFERREEAEEDREVARRIT